MKINSGGVAIDSVAAKYGGVMLCLMAIMAAAAATRHAQALLPYISRRVSLLRDDVV